MFQTQSNVNNNGGDMNLALFSQKKMGKGKRPNKGKGKSEELAPTKRK